jgi:hypothetical protein
VDGTSLLQGIDCFEVISSLGRTLYYWDDLIARSTACTTKGQGIVCCVAWTLCFVLIVDTLGMALRLVSKVDLVVSLIIVVEVVLLVMCIDFNWKRGLKWF